MHNELRFKKACAFAGFLLAALCFGTVAAAKTEPEAKISSKEAKAILLRMAEFMAGSKGFSVSVRDSYDVYQKSGQKIEFSENRKISLARPDRLRIDIEKSDGNRQMLLFDGKELTLATYDRNVYAKAPQPGAIDDMLNLVTSELGIKVPFSVLMKAAAAKELDRETQKIDYVERTTIFGAPAHHLVGRTASVDYQIWVADGDRPLPQRLVLTYRKEKGQPQFRAQFSDWNTDTEMPVSIFEFVLPAGMHKISFLPHQPQTTGRKKVKPAKSGAPIKAGGQK